jgi:hypothetical protein
VIPTQLQCLLPIFHEESKALLLLSRLAFHFNRASASLLWTFVAAWNGVAIKNKQKNKRRHGIGKSFMF